MRSFGFSRARLVLLRSFRAFPKTHNALDALLRVRLIVEGGDHRGARPRPFGDIAVIRIRPEVESQRNPCLAEALGVASASVRVRAQVRFGEKFLDALPVCLGE